MVKRNILFATVIAGLGALLASSNASAEQLAVEPDNGTVLVGATVAVKLVGRDFFAGTVGGGFSVAWDPALVELVDWHTHGFLGDQSLADANTTPMLDSVAGTLRNASVLSFLFGEDGPDFEVAAFTFKGIAVGMSFIDVSIGQFDSGAENRWADNFGALVNPTLHSGSLAVQAVPLPAALPLFGIALAGLVTRRRFGTDQPIGRGHTSAEVVPYPKR